MNKGAKLAIIGALAGVGFFAYTLTNRKQRITSTSESGQDNSYFIEVVADTISEGFMKVGGFTGMKINGGQSASLEILAFLKGFEKYKAMPYFATEDERLRGIKTVGYGHVILPFENFDNGVDMKTANMLFANDVNIASEYVINAVKVELKQSQFDALVSFVFNVGGGAFKKSTMLKYLNAGDYDNAANQFLRWVYQSGVVKNGLYKRRAAEMQIFKFANYVTSFGAK